MGMGAGGKKSILVTNLINASLDVIGATRENIERRTEESGGLDGGGWRGDDVGEESAGRDDGGSGDSGNGRG